MIGEIGLKAGTSIGPIIMINSMIKTGMSIKFKESNMIKVTESLGTGIRNKAVIDQSTIIMRTSRSMQIIDRKKESK